MNTRAYALDALKEELCTTHAELQADSSAPCHTVNATDTHPVIETPYIRHATLSLGTSPVNALLAERFGREED